MFARTGLVLARSSNTSSFARFYKSVYPALTRVKGPNRMSMAAALWTVTTPKFNKASSPARTKAALQVYSKKGTQVLAQARAQKKRAAAAQRRNSSSASSAATRRRRRASKKTASSKNKKRKRTLKNKTPKRKGRKGGKKSRRAVGRPRKASATSFDRFKRSVTHRSLSRVETVVLMAVYRATPNATPAVRVAASKEALVALRKGQSGGSSSSATKKESRRAARKASRKVSKRRTGKKRSTRSRRAAKKVKKVKRVRKPTKTARKTRGVKKAKKSASKARKTVKRSAKKKAATRKTTASTPYTQFRDQVMSRTGLRPTKTNNVRVQRLWFLTASQTRLTAQRRVDMAVALIRKSQPKHHRKGVGKRATRSRAQRRRRAPARKATMSTKSSKKKTNKTTKAKAVAKPSGRRGPRPHNPYLKFYRAMVLTGNVPNHPKGARSRKIKQLWGHTKHLKTIDSRINLGISYATGAIPLPAASPAKEAAPKPKTGKAKRTVKKTAKAVKPAADRKQGTIKFTVPPFYEKSPFSAAYVALHKHTVGSTPTAKMHNLSVAWAQSAYPQSVKDNRTPHQRIAAAANVLKLKQK